MRVGTIFTFGLCFLLGTISITTPAWAEQSSGAAPASLTDEQITQRLDFLDQRFKSEQSDAELWEYGWGAFNGGSMIFSAVQAGQTDNRKDRDMYIVQAVESLVGIADLTFRRLPAFDAATGCSKPVITQEDRLQCLADKEALAQRGAERANEPYRIMPHVGNLGFNLVAGGIVWGLSGFHRAFLTAVPGVLIGEIQLWTTPGQPSQDYDDYRVQFSPMLQMTSRSKNPTVGLMATWKF